MLVLGAHLSASKGFCNMFKTAESIGANTFQFFTRNPRGGTAKAIDIDDVNRFMALCKESDFGTILAHAPYTLNLCSAKPEVRQFALDTFKDDISRMELISNQLYNFHPGSHVGQGPEIGIDYISGALNEILYEDMAGKGSEIGKTFDELREIIDRVDLDEKLGVCLDTCHVYDGGYDIKNDLDAVLNEFDRIIGLDRLKALHLNDSKNPFASHKDRHEKIGRGSLGTDTFENIVNHPVLKNLPMFLETPNELSGYKEEISLLRSLEK